MKNPKTHRRYCEKVTNFSFKKVLKVDDRQWLYGKGQKYV